MPVYEVPRSKASIKQNRFEFKMPDGKKYSVPLLQYIKPSLAQKFDESDLSVDENGNLVGGDTKEAFDLIRLLLDTYFPEADLFAQFEDAEQFGAWMTAWGEASGVTLGESEASSES